MQRNEKKVRTDIVFADGWRGKDQHELIFMTWAAQLPVFFKDYKKSWGRSPIQMKEWHIRKYERCEVARLYAFPRFWVYTFRVYFTVMNPGIDQFQNLQCILFYYKEQNKFQLFTDAGIGWHMPVREVLRFAGLVLDEKK